MNLSCVVIIVFHAILRRRTALELGEVTVGCGIAAETSGEEEGLLIDLRVLAQHGGHVFHAATVHVVVETHARVLLDAAGHVDAVRSQGLADGLYRSVGVAPVFFDVHQIGYLLPQVALGDRTITSSSNAAG